MARQGSLDAAQVATCDWSDDERSISHARKAVPKEPCHLQFQPLEALLPITDVAKSIAEAERVRMEQATSCIVHVDHDFEPKGAAGWAGLQDVGTDDAVDGEDDGMKPVDEDAFTAGDAVVPPKVNRHMYI